MPRLNPPTSPPRRITRMSHTITILTGCTGCGKGSVGRRLATRIDAEILSVDSMKVYRRMDIGTAKPSDAQRAEVAHHLLDVVEPSETFSASRFVEEADRTIEDIVRRGRRVLAVGGTVLYLRALTEGLFEGPSADAAIREELQSRGTAEGWDVLHRELSAVDPEAAERIHPNDARRIVRALEVYRQTGTPITTLQAQWDRDRRRYPCRFFGLRRTKEDQSGRINRRVKRMVELGLVDEVRSLLHEPHPLSETAAQAVGYAEMIAHLEGRWSLDEAVEKIKINSRRLAKHQRTWHKRFRHIQWYDLTEDADLERVADEIADEILRDEQ